MEFELGNRLFELRDVRLQCGERRVVALGARQLEELFAVLDAARKRAQRFDDLVEVLFFLAEILGPLLIVPDRRVLELPGDDFETFALGLEVKDTSAVAPSGPSVRPASTRSG